MKIGILTYHRAHNYGAVLQAYALMTMLKNAGHEVSMIDYWPEYRQGNYELIDFPYFFNKKYSILQKGKKAFTTFVTLPENSVRHSRFKHFIRHQLGISGNPEYKKGEKIRNIYDLVISGSDQIWRYNALLKENQGFDEVYWGEFPKDFSVKKITYAASMGIMEELHADRKMFIQRHLENFNAVSVREQALQDIIQPLTSDPVVHVLDPVFLLPIKKWTLLLKHKKEQRKDKYILFYHLNTTPEAVKLVNQLAVKLGCRVIEIRGVVHPMFFSSRYNQTAGPIEFLNLVAGASFVVSTSFHGVAFSIIFHKQFYALGMKKNSARVQSLLDTLNIGERLLSEINDISVHNDIDYNKVQVKLDNLIEKSVGFLNQQIL